MTHRTQSAQEAFTLIELLVVVAIIAILAAILFPVFAQARESARKITCTSNVKQLMTAILMYAQDYDETFPHETHQDYVIDRTVDWGTSTWVYNDVYVRLQPYVKNYRVFYCPDRAATAPDSGSLCTNDGQPAQRVWGYGYNWGSGYGNTSDRNVGVYGDGCIGKPVLTPDGTNYYYPGSPLAKVGFPSQFPVIGDTGDTPRQLFQSDAFDPRCPSHNSGANSDLTDGGRHQNGNNVGFSDGHAKWYKVNLSYVDPLGTGETTPAVLPNHDWFSINWDGVSHHP